MSESRSIRHMGDLSVRSRGSQSRSTMIGSIGRSLNPSRVISSSLINDDQPMPDVSVRRDDLVRSLEEIDRKAKDRIRPTIDVSRGVSSVRLVPQHLSRDSNGRSNARSYSPSEYNSHIPSKKENISEEERIYIIRTKFRELNDLNSKIEIPDGNHDADALERMYTTALRRHRRTKVGASWFLYLGVGFLVLQYILEKVGLVLPENFVLYQLKALSHYTEVIRELGDPGISIGSSWPAWMKITVIVILQTLVFIIAYKVTKGNETAAVFAQDFIASTNFMGGTKKESSHLEAESAAMDIGNLMSQVKGITSGGGNIIQNVMSVFSNMMKPSKESDIDLNDIPEPDEDIEVENEASSSRRPNLFD